ncbi:MAG: transglycosylase domain-containing protein [Acidimicrobiia bacterium]
MSALASAIAPVVVVALLAAVLFNVAPAKVPAQARTDRPRITRIYAADGSQIAALRAYESFIPVAAEDLPHFLKEAVVAVEDRRFHSHRGVDVRSVVRALWTNMRRNGTVQGASTITQQYVKHAFMPDHERTLMTKVHEALEAIRLEQRLSKEEILHRYLSTVYFGGGAYGVGAAADTFFRKAPLALTLSEAALLAGVVRAPTALNPRSNLAAAEARRRLVLRLMRDQDRITDDQYEAATRERIVLAEDGADPDEPGTIVHAPRQEAGRYDYFVDYARRYLVERYGETRVFHGGLRVETSLDPELQRLAEEAVTDALSSTHPPLSMSLVSVEPGTGLVRALVGGRDFDRSQVNLALGRCDDEDLPSPRGPLCLDGGGTGRQPGSAFKPFVLARALEKGISLERRYRAPARYTFPSCRGVGCSVRNAGTAGYGRLTLRQATASSVNTVFAQLIDDVGVDDVADLAHRLGVTTVDTDGAKYGRSLALGTVEVSPLDMAAAYAVFANRGIQLPASPVLRVTTATGEVLEDNTARRGRRVLGAATADRVTEALKGVVDHGTGRAADIDDPAVAGKTGTTDNNSDAWFVGYTPALSTAVWMGHADSRRPLAGVKGHARVSGGTIPARTWAAFTEPALDRLGQVEGAR